MAQHGHRIHDDAIDTLFQQRLDILHLFVRIEVAVAKHQVTAPGPRGIFGAPRNLGEKGVSDVTDNEPQRMRPPGYQTAGYAVRAIVQPGSDSNHMLARLVIYTVAVVERPRDCRNIDARFPSNIFNGDGHRRSQAFPIIAGNCSACQTTLTSPGGCDSLAE